MEGSIEAKLGAKRLELLKETEDRRVVERLREWTLLERLAHCAQVSLGKITIATLKRHIEEIH